MPVLADQELLTRFAQWLIACAPSHAASKLLSAALAKSPMIGRHVQHAWDAVSDQSSLTAQLRADFSSEEVHSIFQIIGSSEVTWSTSAMRQRQRQEQLNTIAQSLGFETWRRFETAVINEEIEIRIEDPNDPDVIAEKHRADMEGMAEGFADHWSGANAEDL